MASPEALGAIRVRPGERAAGQGVGEGISPIPDDARKKTGPEALGAIRVSPPTPSMGERADAVAVGLRSGLVENLPAIGAGVGAMLGLPGGPGVATATGALGMAGGELLRQRLREFGVQSPSDLPEELRPFAFGGEVVGAGAPIGAAPMIAAARGARFADGFVGRFLNRVLDTAQRRPGAFAGAEASSLSAAAVGEGVAEEVRPGETGTRLAAGVAAGIASPAQYVVQGSGVAADFARRAVRGLSDDARATKAGQILREIVVEAGEDPDLLARRLREADLPEMNRTAAQLTGSPALQAIEADLARSSAKFGRDSQQRAEQSLTTMRNAIAGLEATGDPQALRAAARVREQYFEGLLQGRVADAERRMVEAAENITEDTPQARASLSRRATEIIDGALSQARDAEKELWARVPRTTEAFGDSVVDRANRFATEELLPEEGLPDLVKRFTARLSDQENATTVGELQLFRSRMLDKARQADRNGEAAEARLFGQLAEAALDDMADIPSLGREYDAARSFSRQLNDVFTRTFAGQSVATGRRGARRIPPEAMMRRALGSGNELAAMRMREIETAVQMGSPEALDEMLGIQQRLIRLAANEAVDPDTGRVSATRLARFRRNNAELMERFPEIDAIVSNTQQARRFFDQTTAQADQGRKAIQARAAFARVADAENPVREVERVFSGGAPERDFRTLARTAQRAGKDAVSGLRRSVLDSAFDRAGGTENFSFSAYRRALFQPRRQGQRSAMELMRRNGVIDDVTENRLKRLLDEGEKIVSTVRNRSELESLLGEENAMFDFALRLAGAQAGELSAISGATGSTLVVAGAGSRTLRRILDKIPRNKIRDVMIEAAGNPAFMASLLQRARTQKEKIRLSRQIHAHLWQAGLIRGPASAREETDVSGADIIEHGVRGAAQSAISGVTLPGDVAAGRVAPGSDEALRRGVDLTGVVAGGTAFGAPRGALGTGPARVGSRDAPGPRGATEQPQGTTQAASTQRQSVAFKDRLDRQQAVDTQRDLELTDVPGDDAWTYDLAFDADNNATVTNVRRLSGEGEPTPVAADELPAEVRGAMEEDARSWQSDRVEDLSEQARFDALTPEQQQAEVEAVERRRQQQLATTTREIHQAVDAALARGWRPKYDPRLGHMTNRPPELAQFASPRSHQVLNEYLSQQLGRGN